MSSAQFSVRGLRVRQEGAPLLQDITLELFSRESMALLGPSGCGKSTLLRCLNRLIEEDPRTQWEGDIRFHGVDLRTIEPRELRRKVGFLSRKPSLYPSLSILENIALGLTLQGIRRRSRVLDQTETTLREVGIWDEMKDRLNESIHRLHRGQLQRLCLARAWVLRPEVLLLDEPTASLDPISCARMEESILRLRGKTTLVLATFQTQEAARLCARTAFFLQGEMIECGFTEDLLTTPRDKRTEDFLTQRFS
jgi:phosphate transport system ATP-binding protein